MSRHRWSVRKREGVWRIYDGRIWHDSGESLPDALLLATAYASTQFVWDFVMNRGCVRDCC